MSFLCSDGPSAPVAPDPTTTADAQSAANIKAAFATAKINNPNITSPYGKSTTQYGANAFFGANPAAAAQFKQESYGLSPEDFAKLYSSDRPGMANPYDEYTPYVTQSLNPESQRILDAQQQTRLQLANLSNLGASNAYSVLSNPFSFNYLGANNTGANNTGANAPRNYGLPNYGLPLISSNDPKAQQAQAEEIARIQAGIPRPVGGITGKAANASIADAGAISQGPSAASYLAGGGPKVGDFMAAGGVKATDYLAGKSPTAADYLAGKTFDTTNVAAMPIKAGTTAETAIMARLNPQIAKNRVSTETQLINQGLRPGSEAYNNAINLLGQQENDQRTQAVLQGLGLDMSANAQGYNQALSTGQFGNLAQAQNFGQGLAAQSLTNQAQAQNFGQGNIQQQIYNQAQGQNFGQSATSQNITNQAAGQNYTQNYNTIALNNAAQQQKFAQNAQQAAFENQARQQALAEAIQQRQMPLNEISALMSGSQIQNPQFQPYTGATVAAAPIAQTMQNAYAGAQNAYNQEVASQNETQKGLFDLGSAAITYFSDKRLKSNITRIGTHPLGIGIYEYDIFGRREIGAMAQEVQEVLPEAIHIHPSGFMMVNYGRLNA